jgi:hypothetical protein
MIHAAAGERQADVKRQAIVRLLVATGFVAFFRWSQRGRSEL